MSETLGQRFLKELEAEVPASRKCLERIPEKLFAYKPHEKSMEMGYLATLVAEIPYWIAQTIEHDNIDLATFRHIYPKTTAELVALFDENIQNVSEILQRVSDKTLLENFSLKNNRQLIFTSSKLDNLSSSINHLVHHRGQLTVYLRLNDIPVPSIYGPSADE